MSDKIHKYGQKKRPWPFLNEAEPIKFQFCDGKLNYSCDEGHSSRANFHQKALFWADTQTLSQIEKKSFLEINNTPMNV